jgi:hypothetical protein
MGIWPSIETIRAEALSQMPINVLMKTKVLSIHVIRNYEHAHYFFEGFMPNAIKPKSK